MKDHEWEKLKKVLDKKCRNGARDAFYRYAKDKDGKKRRVLILAADPGCKNIVSKEWPNVLELCSECLRKYREPMTSKAFRSVEIVAKEGYVRMPGLCDHGLKSNQCFGICFKERTQLSFRQRSFLWFTE